MHLGFTYNQKIIGYIIEKRKCFSSFELISYTNNNFAKNSKNQKSVIGYYFFIKEEPVLQSNKKQHIDFIYITKIEYIMLGSTLKKVDRSIGFLTKLV